MNRFEITEVSKVKAFLAKVKETDLIGREFTQKEFDAIFKGTKKNPGIITLDWLRENGERNGEVVSSYWGRANEFVTTRTELFELVGDYDWGTEVLKSENGEVLENVNVNFFLNDEIYREAVERKYGKCEVTSVAMGRRNFYTINIEALERVKSQTEEIRKYYEEKLAELEAKADKYRMILSELN